MPVARYAYLDVPTPLAMAHRGGAWYIHRRMARVREQCTARVTTRLCLTCGYDGPELQSRGDRSVYVCPCCREDLYARLAGFELALPPLRERCEDLGSLIASILARLGPPAADVTLHPAAARALLTYPYPLNVRQLEQALRTAVVLAGGGRIDMEHLPEPIRLHRAAAGCGLRPEDRAVRERLIEILRQTRGNVTAAGRAMGKAPIQVRRWCARFGIDLASFRVRDDSMLLTPGDGDGGAPAAASA